MGRTLSLTLSQRAVSYTHLDVYKRQLLTHDVSTMTKYAYQRLQSGRSMAGIIEVPQSAAIGQIIDDLILIAGTSVTQEYENRVEYLPL